MRHVIPAENWHTELADTIEMAAPGDTIVVRTEEMRQLALIAWGPKRLNRPDLFIEIAEGEED